MLSFLFFSTPYSWASPSFIFQTRRKERPFHCTNFENKEWFVKDDNQGWEEDNGEKLLKNTEAGIQKKWSNEFEKLYPQWINNEKLKEKYIEIAGNTSSKLLEKNKNILLNELANETLLKKLVQLHI